MYKYFINIVYNKRDKRVTSRVYTSLSCVPYNENNRLMGLIITEEEIAFEYLFHLVVYG